MTTPAHARAPAFDNRPVLASALLKAGHAREELPRVGDPSWDLGPAVFRENARRCHVTVHFDVLEHADVQAAMRAYLYVRLNVDLPGYRAKLPPASIRQAFNRARRFFAFAREQLGRLDLGRIDQALADAYARHLRADPARRPVIVGHLLEVVSDLYHYRDHLTGGGLAFEPWAGQAPARVAGYRHVVENRTPRFPEDVIAALLAWSLRYVTVFARDILAVRRELDRLEARRTRLVAADLSFCDRDRRQRRRTRLKAFFDRRRHEGRGVPIWTAAHNGKVRIDPNTGRLAWSSAGHPPAFLRTIDGRIDRLESTTLVLGACRGDDFPHNEQTCKFLPGDVLLAYTDGAIEARNSAGRMMTVDGLQRALVSSTPDAEGGWAATALRAVDEHRFGPAQDDTLMVEIYRPVKLRPA